MPSIEPIVVWPIGDIARNPKGAVERDRGRGRDGIGVVPPVPLAEVRNGFADHEGIGSAVDDVAHPRQWIRVLLIGTENTVPSI